MDRIPTSLPHRKLILRVMEERVVPMTDSYPNTIFKHTDFLKNKAVWLQIFLVFLLGIVLRIFAFQNTHIINSDGVLYIHQARALYYGNRDALLSCYLSYISVLPFFIAGAYAIVHNWLIAGKIVSLFFGVFTLFPIFLLLKRFVKEPFVLFGTLIFALIPVFIDKSVDVLKDPVCWFFLGHGAGSFRTRDGWWEKPFSTHLELLLFSYGKLGKNGGPSFHPNFRRRHFLFKTGQQICSICLFLHATHFSGAPAYSCTDPPESAYRNNSEIG